MSVPSHNQQCQGNAKNWLENIVLAYFLQEETWGHFNLDYVWIYGAEHQKRAQIQSVWIQILPYNKLSMRPYYLHFNLYYGLGSCPFVKLILKLNLQSWCLSVPTTLSVSPGRENLPQICPLSLGPQPSSNTRSHFFSFIKLLSLYYPVIAKESLN